MIVVGRWTPNYASFCSRKAHFPVARRREPAHITALPKRSCSCGSGLALPEYTVPVMRFAAHSSMTLCLCKAFEDESDDAVTYLVWSVSPSFGTYWGIAAIVQSQPFAMPGDNTAS